MQLERESRAYLEEILSYSLSLHRCKENGGDGWDIFQNGWEVEDWSGLKILGRKRGFIELN